jgi:hypothetical protein
MTVGFNVGMELDGFVVGIVLGVLVLKNDGV